MVLYKHISQCAFHVFQGDQVFALNRLAGAAVQEVTPREGFGRVSECGGVRRVVVAAWGELELNTEAFGVAYAYLWGRGEQRVSLGAYTAAYNCEIEVKHNVTHNTTHT